MALPPRDQRYQLLRYEGLQHTDADIVDFEMIFAMIYRREVHRVQVFDFRGLPDMTAEELRGRMLMEHVDAQRQSISFVGDFHGTDLSYTSIKDSILRLCHRLIACSIAGRSQAPEKVTVTDLFYLRGIDVDSVNVSYLLARYLRLFASSMKHVGHDIWRSAAEDAPIVDASTPAVLAPMQVPQPPPPPAAARTMPQRMAMLEDDVHEIRGELGEQRE
nr:hypothetical protein [Tanacetum cinerariifolium]